MFRAALATCVLASGSVRLRISSRHVKPARSRCSQSQRAGIAVPLRLKDPAGVTLSFVSTTTVFGTPIEITLSELMLEAFYPADEATATAILGVRT